MRYAVHRRRKLRSGRENCRSLSVRVVKNSIMGPFLELHGTLRVKRPPMYSFENDRLFGRAGPRTRRYDEHHDENRPSILASPLLALASKNSWTLLEGSSSSTRCNNLHLKDPGHVRALSWLRWAYYSPPASLRLYCVYASADIIACYCPYGWGRLSFNGREIEHAEWLSATACCKRRGTGKAERSRSQN